MTQPVDDSADELLIATAMTQQCSRTWRKWLHWIDFNIPQETFNLTWEDFNTTWESFNKTWEVFNLTWESFNITWEIEHSRTQKLNGLDCARLCSNLVRYDSPVNNMWKLGGSERYKRTTDPAQESKQDSPFPRKNPGRRLSSPHWRIIQHMNLTSFLYQGPGPWELITQDNYISELFISDN